MYNPGLQSAVTRMPPVQDDVLMDEDEDEDDTTAKISSPGETLTSSQAFMR